LQDHQQIVANWQLSWYQPRQSFKHQANSNPKTKKGQLDGCGIALPEKGMRQKFMSISRQRERSGERLDTERS